MSPLFYLSCLLVVLISTPGLGYGVHQFYEKHIDHVYCNATSNTGNCRIYIGQSVTFVCKCVSFESNIASNCATNWTFSGSTKSKEFPDVFYDDSNVTKALAGMVTCQSKRDQSYKWTWNVTVLTPTPPQFNVTPQFNFRCPQFNLQKVAIGDISHPTCALCVHCSAYGAPSPYVSWQYTRSTNDNYAPIVTNQSDPSSLYSMENNGQILCFNNVREYRSFAGSYKCTATNVGGSTSACFTTTVNQVYPFPEPGMIATQNSVYLGGQNATLIMDTTYLRDSTYFQVCRYNRSLQNSLISCCPCGGSSNCQWGQLTDMSVDTHRICQVVTSQPGLYQFQIQTQNYPCFFDIGNPIDVNNMNNATLNDELNYHDIISYSLAGVCLLLLVGIPATFCFTRNHYKKRYVHMEGRHNVDENQVEEPMPDGAPFTASDSLVNDNSNELLSLPNEQSPLLAAKSCCGKSPVLSKLPDGYSHLNLPREHDSKAEHVHGRVQKAIDDDNSTTDRGFKMKHQQQLSDSHGYESSDGLFSNDRRKEHVSKQPLLQNNRSKLQKSANRSKCNELHQGIQHFVSDGSDPLPVATLESAPPLQATDEQLLVVQTTNRQIALPSPVEETRKFHQGRKVVYIIHHADSEEWVLNKLKPLLDQLGVGITTTEDAVAGQTIANARYELVNKADYIIIVFSKKSKEDKSMESKWQSYDLEQAKYKNPDPLKISFIPILYGDMKPDDLPKSLANVVPLKAGGTNLKDKLKESISK